MVLGDPSGALERVDVHAGKRPAAGKGLDVLAQGVDIRFALALVGCALKVL